MRILLLLLCSSGLWAQVINEFIANHIGSDSHEFVEVFGTPNTNYSTLTVLVVEGDSGEDPGQIDRVIPVGSTGVTGHWVSPFSSSQTENDHTLTYLLVDGFSGALGNDIDGNDDGTIDNPLWTGLLDSIGITDNGAGDHNYGPGVVLGPFYDGISFVPGGASRMPDGMDSGAQTDWVRNDFHGEGLPGFSGTLVAGEAYNTPGEMNAAFVGPPGSGPTITEFVFSHDGTDDSEFVEIHGTALTSYATFSLLVIEGDGLEDPGNVDAVISVGSTDIAGFWVSSFFNETLEDGAATLLLVESFSGSVDDDLDTNDDGTLDLMPWTSLADGVSLTNQSGGTTFSYAATQLGTIGGASRFPYYQDTDSASDWVANDSGFLTAYPFGTLANDEALNTPGGVTMVALPLYYGSVSTSSAASLRSSLHDVVKGHIKYPYSSGSTDTWDILESADEDPNNTSNILDVYKNESMVKFGGGTGPYNREHTWPKTYGFPDDTSTAYPYTDCHHLRISHSGYNSDRGSAPFNNCSSGCTERVTDVNNGTGGGSGVYPGNSNWFDGSFQGDNWETWDHRKGDVARSILYMDIRYEGGAHPDTTVAEPNLIATDTRGDIQSTGVNTTGNAYMGLLTVLLEWHENDPPDADEIRRNHIVHAFQGNRNPFVDHPEWVDCLYNNNCGGALPPCALTLYPDWVVTPALSCNSGNLSVLDYAGLMNGTCSCPTPLAREWRHVELN